jgi:hypothetical protein
VRWLLQQHREAFDAGLAINEGGGGPCWQPAVRLAVQLAESLPDLSAQVTDRGGHNAARPRQPIASPACAG